LRLEGFRERPQARRLQRRGYRQEGFGEAGKQLWDLDVLAQGPPDIVEESSKDGLE